MGMIGDEIRTARYNLGWSQEHLADEAGISPEQVGRAEHDDTLDDTTRRILRALQLQIVLVAAPMADFINVLRPVVAKITPERLPIAQAQVLDTLGRAAADMDLVYGATQNVVVAGDADIDQSVS